MSGRNVITISLWIVFWMSIIDIQRCSAQTWCPDSDDDYFEGHCYHLIYDENNLKTWNDANDACSSNGGILASIANWRVQEFIASKINTIYDSVTNNNISLWIGLQRNPPDTDYQWIESHITSNYSEWLVHQLNSSENEPTFYQPPISPSSEEEAYVAIHRNYHLALWRNSATYLDNRWTDEPETSLFGYICVYETVNSYEGKCHLSLLSSGHYIPEITDSNGGEFENKSTTNWALLGTTVERFGYGAWTTTDLRSSFLEINMKEAMVIREVWTQGRNNPLATESIQEEFTRSYQISYSYDGSQWNTYRLWGAVQFPQILQGNKNPDTIQKHVLQRPILAQYIRITPVGYWSYMTKFAMRIELIGCSSSTGISNFMNSLTIQRTEDYHTTLAKASAIDGFNNQIANHQSDDSLCASPVESAIHTAFPTQVIVQLNISSRLKLVTVKTKNIPCSQHIYGSDQAYPILQMPHQTDLYGSYTQCDLVTYSNSTEITITQCTFLCEMPDGTTNIGNLLSVVIGEVPAIAVQQPEWSLCYIGVNNL